ncbi:MAG TPA: ABC transporter ATP-binding protein [Nakamurella sp.]|nr:ABC transporter ATP-binding protein [Nakamurella sp.]
MREIQRRTGVAVLLITHNLAVARYFSHRTAVVYLGRIVENGDESLYREPRHPYTRALLDASPSLAVARPQRVRLSGDLPDPHHPPPGCRFHTRCPIGPLTHPERTGVRRPGPAARGPVRQRGRLSLPASLSDHGGRGWPLPAGTDAMCWP